MIQTFGEFKTRFVVVIFGGTSWWQLTILCPSLSLFECFMTITITVPNMIAQCLLWRIVLAFLWTTSWTCSFSMMPRYHRILHRSIDRGITDFTIYPSTNRPVRISSGTRLYAMKNLSLRETIDHIKESILLSEIVGEYVDIHEEGNRGRGHQCLCPFHDDRNPSMHINDDKGILTD